MIGSDSRLVAMTRGNSDSDSDSAPLVMAMHSIHGVKNPGLPTLIYKQKTETVEAQVFPLSVRSGQCHGVSNGSEQQ